MKKIFAFSLVSLLLFAFAAVASAQKAVRPTPPQTTPPVVKLERATKFDGSIAFPEVEGWELSEKNVYPTPELGYSVNYESPAARITVYVYNGGQPSIPNELTGVVADEMKAAQANIMALVEHGAYEAATLIKDQTVTLGGGKGKLKSLHSQYALKANGRELDSHIYVFPYNNYFVKVRLTTPKSEGKAVAANASLFEALDILFSK